MKSEKNLQLIFSAMFLLRYRHQVLLSFNQVTIEREQPKITFGKAREYQRYEQNRVDDFDLESHGGLQDRQPWVHELLRDEDGAPVGRHEDRQEEVWWLDDAFERRERSGDLDRQGPARQ